MHAQVTLLTMLLVAALLWPPTAKAAPDEGRTYRVIPAVGNGAPPRGWGVYATVQGRSMGLRSRGDGWVDDPQVSSGDVQAGFGWRRNRMSTVLGYQEIDFGQRLFQGPGVDPMNTGKPGEDSIGVIGLGFSLRSR